MRHTRPSVTRLNELASGFDLQAVQPRKNPAVFIQILAALGLLLCLLLGARMCLSAPRQRRIDALLQRFGYRLKAQALRLYRWPASRRRAAQEAEAAIERARKKGQWDGNVYRPESFGKKPRKPH